MNTKTATTRKEYLNIMKAIKMLDGEVMSENVVGHFEYKGDWVFSQLALATPGVRKVDVFFDGKWHSVPWKDVTVEISFLLEGTS